jgi:cyclopropane fatty-acyl-phospholipid synthase-like methyltransferase
VRRLRYELRYWLGRPPWDTGITPPEVMAYLQRTPPAAALDLGCGTGTNAVTLARHGWRVTGVDFSWRALRAARRKARQARVEIRFLHRDAARLGDLAGPFDLALDIGCFHSLEPSACARYADTLARLLRPGATYLLYAFLEPAAGWPGETDVRRTFDGAFKLAALERGDYNGRPSGWFTWTRR